MHILHHCIIYAKYNNYYDISDEVIEKHLGQIAEVIVQWEGVVADELRLTSSDVAAILIKYPRSQNLQT